MKKGDQHFFSHVLQSKIFFVFLLCIVIVSAVRLSNEIARRMAITKQISSLRHQVDQLRSERDSLSYLMTTLSTDAYIEDAARKKLNLAKPGEQVVVVPAPAQKERDMKVAPTLTSMPSLWWSYFFEHHAQ
jgi:cell division protein FtsL